MTETKIDRLILQNIEILQIRDTKRLQNMGILEPATANGINYTTVNGEHFKRLNIENDGLVHKLFCSAKLFNNKVTRYCHLTTLVRDEYGTNLNCWTTEDYYSHLADIVEHLDSVYGIIVDISDVQIKEIELNKTIELEKPFEEYCRPLQLLFANLPKTFTATNVWADTEESDKNIDRIPRTYSANTKRTPKSKRYMMCTMYDKTKQLEQTIRLEQQYLRLELRLVGAEKIKRSFGTNRFAALTDERLNDFMHMQIQKLFLSPYIRWSEERDKLIIRLITEERELSKHWIVNVLRRLQDMEIQSRRPFVLDVEEILIVFQYISQDVTRRKNEIMQQFLKQAQKYEKSMCKHDHAKLDEILTKLIA